MNASESLRIRRRLQAVVAAREKPAHRKNHPVSAKPFFDGRDRHIGRDSTTNRADYSKSCPDSEYE
jgi:hypothetical protein